jgi:transcriptional regulator with XRE-family HTH domain
MFSLNLKRLRKTHRLSQQRLSELLGIPRTTLSGWERGTSEPSIEMLLSLAQQFEVSTDELLKTEQQKNLDPPLKVLAITVDSNNQGNIELVQTKAAAGYWASFADPEYLKELPRLYFPNIPQGTYRAFEVQGDSMLPFEDGNILITRYVENLQSIKNAKLYVLVSKSEGVVFKRVYLDAPKARLILHSDNILYPPYTLDFSEIQEIWQYYAHVNFKDLKVLLEEYVDEKLLKIEKKLHLQGKS